MRSRILYVLFALVLFATTWGLTSTPPKEAASPILAVETVTVRPVTVRPEVTLSGRVEPQRSALLTAQVSAPVLSRKSHA